MDKHTDIRVMIVDDQNIIIQGLSMILASEKNIEVVKTANNGREAVETCKEMKIDVVLMDIRMPIMNGVEATLEINGLNKEIKVIILTTFNDDEYIFTSLKNGASGYLLKDATPQEIINAIYTVYNGGTLINPDVATKVVQRLTHDEIEIKEEKIDSRIKLLTSREIDICHLLSEGKNNKEISKKLYISEGTVKNNITRILDKLEFRDRTQLALFAAKNRL